MPRLITVTLAAVLMSTTVAVATPVLQFANSTVVGQVWSFEVAVADPDGVSAQGFQITTQIAGPGALTLLTGASQAVSVDPAYWVAGNSQGATVIDRGAGKYEFGDGPNNGMPEALLAGDKLARFAFEWTVPGWYSVTQDPSVLNSFALDPNFRNQAVSTPDARFYVPEPLSGALALLGLAWFGRRPASQPV